MDAKTPSPWAVGMALGRHMGAGTDLDRKAAQGSRTVREWGSRRVAGLPADSRHGVNGRVRRKKLGKVSPPFRMRRWRRQGQANQRRERGLG